MADMVPPQLPSLAGTAVKTDTVEPVITPEAPTVAIPVVAAPAKPAYKSATIITNGIVGVAGVVLSMIAVAEPGISEQIRHLFPNEELGVSAVGLFTSALAFANLLIRFYRTSQPIQK